MTYISSKNIEKVIRYIPILSEVRRDLPPWLLSSKQTWFPERKIVEDFLQCLYEEGFIFENSWQSCYQQITTNHCEQSLLRTLAKVNEIAISLTFHYKFEQYRNGHIVEQINNGQLLKLLRKLKQVHKRSQNKIIWLNSITTRCEIGKAKSL